MNATKKAYEYPPQKVIYHHDLVHIDDYLLAIRFNGWKFYVAILHVPFKRWLQPVQFPDVPFHFRISKCYTLPKPRSFAIDFYDIENKTIGLMICSLSPACDSVTLERCVPLGVCFGRSRILFDPERERIFVASRRHIKELSMDGDDRGVIGEYGRWPDNWMLYEHTIYAIYIDGVCRLRVCAFDVQCREWRDDELNCLRHSSRSSDSVFAMLSHRSALLVCYQQYVTVLDVVTGVWRRVDIGHLRLPEHRYVGDAVGENTTTYFQMLGNGELMVLSMSMTKRLPWETRFRVVTTLKMPSLSEIALRTVHQSMPWKTRKVLLHVSPLGDASCLVKFLLKTRTANVVAKTQRNISLK